MMPEGPERRYLHAWRL